MKIVFAFVIFCLIESSYGFFGFTRKFNTHEEPFIPLTNRVFNPRPKAVRQYYMQQPRDHFNPQDKNRWLMRYMVNNENFQPGGPIFIYVGGEWTIGPGSISAGTHIYDLAKELNGTIYYTEHRYYGQSHPTENTSTDNLRWLSIDQGLADLAFFIQHVKRSSPDLSDSGVVMVGGSYSATMVAWMRMKYPHLVNGAWASSAPLRALVDYFEYKEVMADAIQRVGGDECYTTIENAFQEMERLVEISDVETLKTEFNLCSALDLSSNDVAHFFYEVSDIVAGLVQGHRTGRIEGACDLMRRLKEDDAKTDMQAFAGWVIYGNDDCLDMSYLSAVRKYRDSTWGSEGNQQMRQWTYQTCSEFGWFQTSTSRNQIFGSPEMYPIQYFVDICQDLYDFSFNLTAIERNVARTNVHYGGFELSLTNVYFTHGDLDPWHAAGILEDLNESSPVVILPLSSHVSDLGQISLSDSDEARASKERVREHVHRWLGIEEDLPEL